MADKFKKRRFTGSCLGQLVEFVILDLRFVSSSPMFGGKSFT